MSGDATVRITSGSRVWQRRGRIIVFKYHMSYVKVKRHYCPHILHHSSSQRHLTYNTTFPLVRRLYLCVCVRSIVCKGNETASPLRIKQRRTWRCDLTCDVLAQDVFFRVPLTHRRNLEVSSPEVSLNHLSQGLCA